jgi:hypothetical protein
MHRVRLDGQNDAVKSFFLTLPADPSGLVLELNGQAVACVLPMSERNGDSEEEWTDVKNARRSDLIDKEIAGTLSVAEAVELRGLQQAMLRHRRQVAPLPLAASRQLYEQLLSASRARSSGT